MKLLTKDLIAKFPKIGSTSNKLPEDVPIIAKFFNPCGAGTWYATEYDSKTEMFFGYAAILEGELGYFTLDDLKSYRGPLGIGIERDLYYSGETLAEVMKRGR